jgi:hypothetical protein
MTGFEGLVYKDERSGEGIKVNSNNHTVGKPTPTQQNV